MHTEPTNKGLEYWAKMAELRDEKGCAAELRKIDRHYRMLQEGLSGLLGTSSKEDLLAMGEAVRAHKQDRPEDVRVTLAAINALLASM